MSFEINFSPRAEETYAFVIEQLRERWGAQFVIKLENKLEKCIHNLTNTPHMYPTVEGNIELRRCIIHKNCSMIYKISGNIVSIAYFWDNRQEPLMYI